MSTRHRRTSWFLLLLGAISLVVYWPLYTGGYTLAGNAADLIMPAFSHMREALLQGTWPLWNKYQLQGIATSMDLIYWNPVYLLLAMVFSSPDIALNALYLFLIFLSGLGFYKLSGLILENDRSAVLSGLCYPLAGFFVVPGAQIEVITAAAWIPILLYSHQRYFQVGKIRDLSILAISFYLFATGTSPGLVCTGVALLLAQGIYNQLHYGSLPARRNLYSLATISAAGFLIWRIYLERWIAYVNTPDFIPEPEHLKSFIHDLSSLVFSKTTAVETDDWGFTGPVHVHMFAGILVVVLALFAIAYSRTKIDRRLGLLSLVFLGLSVLFTLILKATSGHFLLSFSGMVTGAKLLFIGNVLLLGVRGLEKGLSADRKNRLSFQIPFLITGGIALLGGVVLKVLHIPGLSSWLLQLDLWKSAFFLFCAAAFFFIRSPQWRWIALGGLIIAELGISNYLNQDSNLYPRYPSSVFSDQIHAPEHIPHHIDINQPIGRYLDADFQLTSLHKNTGTLFKKIVRDGYWPWMSNLQAEIFTTPGHEEQLRYPLFYLSRDTTSQTLPSYTNYGDHITLRSQTDHHWELSFLNHYEKFLILNQNYDKNWIAYIDLQRISIAPTRAGMMKIPVKPGVHTVTFQYRSDGLIHIFGVTMVVFILLIIFMIKSRTFPMTALALCFPVLMVFGLNWTKSTSQTHETSNQEPAVDSADYLMNYENSTPYWFVRPKQITPLHSFDGYRSESFDQTAEYSATLQVHRDALKGKNELKYRFQLKAPKSVDLAIVVKTYTDDDDAYNIRYVTSLDTEQWRTLEGQFPLQELQDPLVKAEFYIWNYKKQDFLIDDIEIKLNP